MNAAMIASPMVFTMVPPRASITRAPKAKESVTTPKAAASPTRLYSAVEPQRSLKRIVTPEIFSASPGRSDAAPNSARNSGIVPTWCAVTALNAHSVRSSLACRTSGSWLSTRTLPPGATSTCAGASEFSRAVTVASSGAPATTTATATPPPRTNTRYLPSSIGARSAPVPPAATRTCDTTWGVNTGPATHIGRSSTRRTIGWGTNRASTARSRATLNRRSHA